MTPALLDRPASVLADPATAAGHAGRAGGGRLTLEERLSAALHEAHANGSTECPVCHARMAPSAGAAPGGAACSGCGSELS